MVNIPEKFLQAWRHGQDCSQKHCSKLFRSRNNPNVEEIEAIAKFFEIDFNEYMEKFVILRHDRKGLSLDEKANGSCIYYDETTQLCQIQAVKPEQCKKFPIEWNFENFEKECAGAACLISK